MKILVHSGDDVVLIDVSSGKIEIKNRGIRTEDGAYIEYHYASDKLSVKSGASGRSTDTVLQVKNVSRLVTGTV